VVIVPKEYRDPYSQAKIFVPTHEEINKISAFFNFSSNSFSKDLILISSCVGTNILACE
jgi:hypothetical protein